MPFTCHQCGAVQNQKRSGKCQICFTKSVDLCPGCAFWELGPVAPTLQQELRPRSRRSAGFLQGCPAPANVIDPHAVNLLQTVQCATLNHQWANHGFDADHAVAGRVYVPDDQYVYPVVNNVQQAAEQAQQPGFHVHNSDVCDAQFSAVAQAMLDDFDDLYAREEQNNPPQNAQADNDVERVMLLTYASAQERCGYLNDRYVHRWDLPHIAGHHFTTCFAGMNALQASNLRGTAALVLSSVVIEDLLLGRVSTGYAYWRVADVAQNAVQALDFVRMSALLLHLWFKNAPVGAVNGGFLPEGANGIVTPDMRARVLTQNGRAFTKKAEKKLAALYACFSNNAPHIPQNDVRFGALAIGNHQLLNAQHKRFLQSLPRFDNIGNNAANRTGCENAVRARVRKMFGRLRAALQATPAAPPMNSIGADLIAANNANAFDAVLDRILAVLARGLNWIETSSDEGVFTAYAQNPGGVRWLSFGELRRRQVNWSHAFPACMANANGTFPGQHALPADLAGAVDGRQNAKRWYPQWRWDKDHRLYGGHSIAPHDRGVLAQLSFWVNAPEPNRNYGVHTVVWNPAVLERSVLTVGDKGRPVRSMLLLIHDLVCAPPDVKGDATGGRAATLRALLDHASHYENVATNNYVPQNPQNAQVHEPANINDGRHLLLCDLYRAAIGNHPTFNLRLAQDSGQRAFVNQPQSVPTPLIECHIFGNVSLHADGWAACIEEAALVQMPQQQQNAIGNQRAFAATMAGMNNRPYALVTYRGNGVGGGNGNWRGNTRPNYLPDPMAQPNALSGVVAKVPTHSAP